MAGLTALRPRLLGPLPGNQLSLRVSHLAWASINIYGVGRVYRWRQPVPLRLHNQLEILSIIELCNSLQTVRYGCATVSDTAWFGDARILHDNRAAIGFYYGDQG